MPEEFDWQADVDPGAEYVADFHLCHDDRCAGAEHYIEDPSDVAPGQPFAVAGLGRVQVVTSNNGTIVVTTAVPGQV
jgi:hypothetical protein